MVSGLPIRPSLALAAYIEPFLEGRRVLVFGSAESSLGSELIARGARLVHLYDPDAARAARLAVTRSTRDLFIGALGEDALALRDAVFDIGIIEHIGTSAAPPGKELGLLKRALSPRGIALCATPNPEVRQRLLGTRNAELVSAAIDYYGLYDLMAAEFAHVRMLGQTPFVGYALVDFAPDAEPEPAIDTGLLRGSTEEPEWFVALGSAQPVRLDDYALVQLPLTATLAAGERSLPGSAMAPPPALEKELSKREAWIRELEARAATADERADAVQDEVEELTACLVSLGLPERPSPDELGALRQRLGSTADANEAAAKAAEDLALARAELVEARALLASREDELRSLRELDGSGEADELDALERQLGERAQRIREVERALAEAERFGRELIVELGQVAQIRAPSAAEPAPAPAPSELSARAARAEADLMAATWAIGELEWRLAAQQSKEPNAAALEDKLECLEGELARQAVLLEQANSGRPA